MKQSRGGAIVMSAMGNPAYRSPGHVPSLKTPDSNSRIASPQELHKKRVNASSRGIKPGDPGWPG